MPTLFQTHRPRLRLEVGELATRHFVQIDLGRRCLKRRLKRRILTTDRFPIVGNLADRADVQTCVTLGKAQRLNDGPQRRLRCVARQRVHCGVHCVHTGLGCGHNGRNCSTGRVVCVEVDRQADLFFQRTNQRASGGGLQQTGHILQTQNMGTCITQLLTHIDVVFQVILRAVRIVDVTRVADRAFTDLATVDHRVHRDAHVFHPVERVEHAEHVHTGFSRLFDKELNHVVGIVRVTHTVRRTQQHLRHQVRHLFTNIAQTLPRAFLQEAVGHVERRPAPAFDREQLRQLFSIGRRDLDHVDRPHPRRQKRLVTVTHGGVGDQHLLLRRHPVSNRLRALFLKQIAGAIGHRIGRGFGRARRFQIGVRFRTAFGFRMPVHRDVGDVSQNLGATVLARFEIKQLGRLVDELGVVLVRQECRVLQQVLDKVDVGRHAANTEFAQRTVHTRNRLFRRLRPSRHLHQKRVVVARDYAARISRAAVQTDAHTGRRTIGGDPAIVGDKVVLRVFCSDPRLQRVAVQADVILRCLACGLGQRLALGNQDLRLNDVDAGDFFGDGVFHLNTGVHLDEVERACVHIHQEFDGARAFIVHMGTDFAAQFAQLFALRFGQVRRRRAFNDLLVAALNRTVTLIEVIDVAMAVAKDLNLDVTGAHDHLFQITFAVAKGGLGLAAAFHDLLGQFLGVHDRAHTAATTTPRRFQHQREADFLGLFLDGVHVIAQNLGRGDNGHTGRNRNLTGAGLIAQLAHRFRLGTDKGDAVLFAGIYEIGVLRQQAVTGVDRIRTAFLGHANDLVNRQIGRDRPQPLTNAVGFIRFEPVQAKFVFLGKNGNGLFPHLVGRTHNADRDLATVGNEDLLEVGHKAGFLISNLVQGYADCHGATTWRTG